MNTYKHTCSQHKQAGERDLVHKLCEDAACGRQASFGDAKDGMARFCSQHKLAGHIRARANGYTLRGRCKMAARKMVVVAGGAMGRHAAVQFSKQRMRELGAALAIRIYDARPDVARCKYGSMYVFSQRYGVSPKTIKDIWSRKVHILMCILYIYICVYIYIYIYIALWRVAQDHQRYIVSQGRHSHVYI